MSREIKFRGMTDEGKWVYGWPVKSFWYGCETISIGDAFCGGELDGDPVEDETIGQFAGLKDKNGVDIYEGDIVYIGGYGLYECEFPFLELYDAVMENDIGEIKGNIHENPELLNA